MTAPRVAVVFPGPGSLRSGLPQQWYAEPATRELFDQASVRLGRDVTAYWQDPATTGDPVTSELVTFVCGVAAHRNLLVRGLEPAVVAGHSAGEFAALEASGALPFSELVDLVQRRAELVAQASRSTTGAMAAVAGRGAAAAVTDLLRRRDDEGVLVIAYENGPHQVVISGHCDAVDRAGDDVRDIGLRFSRVNGSGALHSPLMQAVSERFAESLANLSWSVPAIPVVPTIDATPTRDPHRLLRLLREHLVAPVRWAPISRAFGAMQIDAVVECGGSCVLGPFIRQVNPLLPTYLLSDPRSPLPELSHTEKSPTEKSQTLLKQPFTSRPEVALPAKFASITPA